MAQKYAEVHVDEGGSGFGKAFYIVWDNDIPREKLKDVKGKNFKSFGAVMNYMDEMGFDTIQAFTSSRSFGGQLVQFPILLFIRNDEIKWTVKKGRIILNPS